MTSTKHDPVSATTKRLVDQLRASQAAARAEQQARLADPNTPPDERKMLEASERRDAQVEAARIRHEAQEREAHQREAQRRFDEHLIEAQRRGQPTRRRMRRPTLAGVAQQAAKAGIETSRYDVRPDGTISVVTGKPGEATEPENDKGNPWDGVLQ